MSASNNNYSYPSYCFPSNQTTINFAEEDTIFFQKIAKNFVKHGENIIEAKSNFDINFDVYVENSAALTQAQFSLTHVEVWRDRLITRLDCIGYPCLGITAVFLCNFFSVTMPTAVLIPAGISAMVVGKYLATKIQTQYQNHIQKKQSEINIINNLEQMLSYGMFSSSEKIRNSQAEMEHSKLQTLLKATEENHRGNEKSFRVVNGKFEVN